MAFKASWADLTSGCPITRPARAECELTCLSVRFMDGVREGWLGVILVGAQGWFVFSCD